MASNWSCARKILLFQQLRKRLAENARMKPILSDVVVRPTNQGFVISGKVNGTEVPTVTITSHEDEFIVSARGGRFHQELNVPAGEKVLISVGDSDQLVSIYPSLDVTPPTVNGRKVDVTVTSGKVTVQGVSGATEPGTTVAIAATVLVKKAPVEVQRLTRYNYNLDLPPVDDIAFVRAHAHEIATLPDPEARDVLLRLERLIQDTNVRYGVPAGLDLPTAYERGQELLGRDIMTPHFRQEKFRRAESVAQQDGSFALTLDVPVGKAVDIDMIASQLVPRSTGVTQLLESARIPIASLPAV